MAQSRELQDALIPVRSLVRMLEKDDVAMVLVRADGDWHVGKAGRITRQNVPLPTRLTEGVIKAVCDHGPTCCLDDWWARHLPGGALTTIVFERRPNADRLGLAEKGLTLLRNHLPRGANGVIFGKDEAARSALLLGLTRCLPVGFVVYIGPRPPVDPDQSPILHITPPKDVAQRRELTGLLGRADVVLFDGPSTRADVELLFPASHATNRWLAVDGVDALDWSAPLEFVEAHRASLDTIIGVDVDSGSTAALTYFAIRGKDEWEILLDCEVVDTSGRPETSSPLIPQITASYSRESPSSSPAKMASNFAGEDEPTHDRSVPVDETDFDVASLLGDQDKKSDLIRESGEIAVPGFTSRRRRALARDESDAVVDEDSPTDILRGKRVDNALPQLIADSDIDDVEIPEIDPQQLRQTMEGSVASESLRRERALSLSRTTHPVGDSGDDNPDLRTTQEARPSNRKKKERPISSSNRTLDRRPGLGGEASSATFAPADSSGQWPRSATGHRVIPVPSSTKSTGDAPSPPGNDDPATEELALDDILDDLKERRRKKKE